MTNSPPPRPPHRNRLTFDKSAAFTRDIEAIVPGGAHTYSRGRDQFPENAPSGITRGEGAYVWDADGNCLVDWSMGLTSVSLGHAFPPVVEAVCEAARNGVNFQRPSQIEYEAARTWLDICGDDMVKFARHGSAVTTAAVKLARAYTGRTIVAAPKEHPFFSFDDWFIGSTPCDFGVPESIRALTRRFIYGDMESLHDLFRETDDNIACVIMEPVKFEPPPEGYLSEVHDLCRREGALLILDEMITGLKMGFPGAQADFGVRADITTWGKGIANGFAMAALTGRGDVMRLGGLEPEGARKLFLLSSTHGGESVGFAALNATARYFRDNDVIAENWQKGEALQTAIRDIITRAGLDDYLSVQGYPPMFVLSVLGVDGQPDLAYTTLLRQEMINRGNLFQNLFVMTPSHGEREFGIVLDALSESCAVFRTAIDRGSVEGFLDGPPVKPVFRRYL